MQETTVEVLKNDKKQMLDNIRSDTQQLLSFLYIMGYFHRYDLDAQLDIYKAFLDGKQVEALATKEIWQQTFHTDVAKNAEPIAILAKDAAGNDAVKYVYDVSSTAAFQANNPSFKRILWHYDKEVHAANIQKSFFPAGIKDFESVSWRQSNLLKDNNVTSVDKSLYDFALDVAVQSRLDLDNARADYSMAILSTMYQYNVDQNFIATNEQLEDFLKQLNKDVRTVLDAVKLNIVQTNRQKEQRKNVERNQRRIPPQGIRGQYRGNERENRGAAVAQDGSRHNGVLLRGVRRETETAGSWRQGSLFGDATEKQSAANRAVQLQRGNVRTGGGTDTGAGKETGSNARAAGSGYNGLHRSDGEHSRPSTGDPDNSAQRGTSAERDGRGTGEGGSGNSGNRTEKINPFVGVREEHGVRSKRENTLRQPASDDEDGRGNSQPGAAEGMDRQNDDGLHAGGALQPHQLEADATRSQGEIHDGSGMDSEKPSVSSNLSGYVQGLSDQRQDPAAGDTLAGGAGGVSAADTGHGREGRLSDILGQNGESTERVPPLAEPERVVDELDGSSVVRHDMAGVSSGRMGGESARGESATAVSEEEPLIKTSTGVSETDMSTRSGKRSALKANIGALKIRNLMLEEQRTHPTEEEITVLRQYSGFGGLADVFDPNKDTFSEDEKQELKSVLNEHEYRSCLETTVDAFYTSPRLIQTIYQGLIDYGFSGGNILDPSTGTGRFIEYMPADVKAASKIIGVELDSVSASIAKLINANDENVTIINAPYQQVNYDKGSFDLVISNVPFSQERVSDDTEYKDKKYMIHDYFLNKMIDQTRSGGIVVAITSKGTMDKKDNSLRKEIAAKADLLMGFRLPNDTFKSAGTEATTDLLIFKKRERVLTDEELPAWTESQMATLSPKGDPIFKNTYFIENPAHILGEEEIRFTGFRYEAVCNPFSDHDALSLLAGALHKLPYKDYVPAVKEPPAIEQKNFVQDDRLFGFHIDTESGNIILKKATGEIINPNLKPKVEAERRSILEIRDLLKVMFNAEVNDCSDAELAHYQERLTAMHDAHVSKYGYIQKSRALKGLLRQDASSALIRSLEKFKDDEFVCRSDVFTKRTIRNKELPTQADTPKDALAISLQRNGKVDIGYMASLVGCSKKEIINDLLGSYIYREQEINLDNLDMVVVEKYVTKDEFLSGNIREKMAKAEGDKECAINVLEFITMETGISYEQLVEGNYPDNMDNKLLHTAKECVKNMKNAELNFQALQKVLPPDITAAEIHADITSHWIPTRHLRGFIAELFFENEELYDAIDLKYVKETGDYQLRLLKMASFEKTHQIYGTKKCDAVKLIEKMLNLKNIQVTHKDPMTNKDVYEKTASLVLQQKAAHISKLFKEWLFRDEARRNELVMLYNERFNSHVNRDFDGSLLDFPGMNTEISLRPHQKNAVARTLFGGNTLLAHAVGAGKTFEMQASAMEAKRIGLCSKSLMIMPKHLVEDFGAEFLRLYPNANVLLPTPDDFKKERRQELFAKIISQDWDAIVMSYQQFEKLPLSKKHQEAFIQEEIESLQHTEAAYKNATRGDDNFNSKRIGAYIRSLKFKLEHISKSKDEGISFEELGIDRLYVDESHYFKNMFVKTQMSNVSGISVNDTQKGLDFYNKVKYLNQLTHERGLVFASGTPISNSVSEMYILQKYLAPSRLQEAKLYNFDDWATTFGEKVTDVEISPTGTSFRTKTRFSKFNNIQELQSMFHEFADVKTADMLNLAVPECKIEVVKAEASDVQLDILQSLEERSDAINRRSPQSVQKKSGELVEDNFLLITNHGRLLAMDPRLLDSKYEDFAGSKINMCVDKVVDIYNKSMDDKLTQVIFSDIGTPNPEKRKNGEFCLYDDVRQKLEEQGVPHDEIAYVHDAKTPEAREELFKKVRSGKIRIIFGSSDKLGVGTNIQDKLVAMHELDVPWTPAKIEQRMGRIVRQGNTNKEVKIFRYVTESTFDAYMWQTNERKQRFIGQLITAKSGCRSIEDVDDTALTYAEIKSICTGNPLIQQKLQLENQVERLTAEYSHYLKEKADAKLTMNVKIIPETEHLEKLQKEYIKSLTHLKEHVDDETMILNGQEYKGKEAIGQVLAAACKEVAKGNYEILPRGKFKGSEFTCLPADSKHVRPYLKIKVENINQEVLLGATTPEVNANRLFSINTEIQNKVDTIKQEYQNLQSEREEIISMLEQPFIHAAELEAANKELTAITKECEQSYKAEKRENTIDMEAEHSNSSYFVMAR